MFEVIVIGSSAGGLNALKYIITNLSDNFNIPIIIVQHIAPNFDSRFPDLLNNKTGQIVKEVEEKEKIKKGFIYFAPPNYHILIEKDKSFSLSCEEKRNYSRPSIDILFESAAEIYFEKLIGIILTGANRDGAEGLKKIKEFGGFTIVQNPKEALSSTMPLAAIDSVEVEEVLSLSEIVYKLNSFIK